MPRQLVTHQPSEPVACSMLVPRFNVAGDLHYTLQRHAWKMTQHLDVGLPLKNKSINTFKNKKKKAEYKYTCRNGCNYSFGGHWQMLRSIQRTSSCHFQSTVTVSRTAIDGNLVVTANMTVGDSFVSSPFPAPSHVRHEGQMKFVFAHSMTYCPNSYQRPIDIAVSTISFYWCSLTQNSKSTTLNAQQTFLIIIFFK